MKLRANRNGLGKIGNYTLSIGANEAKTLNLLNEDGTSKELRKIIDKKNNKIIIKEEKEMKGIKLEKAFVKYDKEGNYNYTVNNEVMDFENEEKAIEYVMNHIEKDYEYYFYESQEDLNNDEHYKVLICNKMKKTLEVKNYATNAEVFVNDELGIHEETITIDFDGLDFDSNDELEDYIYEQITQQLHFIMKKIDENSLNSAIESIWIQQNHRIK